MLVLLESFRHLGRFLQWDFDREMGAALTRLCDKIEAGLGCIYIPLHSSASGHLGCFYVLAILNSVAVNIRFMYLFEL